MKNFVLYDRPSDFPEDYVIREFEIEPGNITDKGIFAKHKNLNHIIDLMEHTEYFFMPEVNPEEPQILGVWL